jgi:3-methyladenine DNA glycosylase AlkD
MLIHLLEVERELKKLANDTYKKSNDAFAIPRSVGIQAKRLTDRLKQGFSFSKLPDNEQWKIWNFIFRNSRLHETQMTALRFAENRASTNGKREWNYLRGWIDFVDNWAHSDALSKIYSFLLEQHPDLILPQLKKWNHSSNPWKQRASIVSLIYYASPKRKAPPIKTALELTLPLVKSRDKYVAKAVGWTLRESYKLSPKETFAFIKTHVRELAPDSFSYATEKIPPEQKDALKRARKPYSHHIM